MWYVWWSGKRAHTRIVLNRFNSFYLKSVNRGGSKKARVGSGDRQMPSFNKTRWAFVSSRGERARERGAGSLDGTHVRGPNPLVPDCSDMLPPVTLQSAVDTHHTQHVKTFNKFSTVKLRNYYFIFLFILTFSCAT